MRVGLAHVCTPAFPNKVAWNSSFITETLCDLQKSGHAKLPRNFVFSSLGQAAAEVLPKSLPQMCTWLSLAGWCRLCNLDSLEIDIWWHVHGSSFMVIPREMLISIAFILGKGRLSTVCVSGTCQLSVRSWVASASCRGLPKHFEPCVGYSSLLAETVQGKMWP